MPKLKYIYRFFYKKDFLNQFLFFFKGIPYLKKIIIHVSFKDISFRSHSVIPFLIWALKFLTNQTISFNLSKKDSSFYYFKKKDILSLNITLRDANIYLFLDKLFIFLFNKIEPSFFDSISFNKNIICFGIRDLTLFSEIDSELVEVQKSHPMKLKTTIFFVFNKSIIKNYNKFFLCSFQIPSNFLCLLI